MAFLTAPFYVNASETKNSPAYIDDDAFIQQALFLGSHDEVMSVVPVVHNVLQVNTCAEKRGKIHLQRLPGDIGDSFNVKSPLLFKSAHRWYMIASTARKIETIPAAVLLSHLFPL